MRRIIVWILVIQTVLFCSACMGSVQIEDRNYVMAMGIDYDAENAAYVVSLSFPDLKALTGDGLDLHYPVMEIRGRNLKEIEDIYHQESNKRLDFGQIQTIIFGKTILEHQDAMEAAVSYMKNHQTFSRTILVCAALSAADIVALDTSVNGSIGIYIKNMFENNGMDYGGRQVSLNDLIVAMANKNETVKMPYLLTDGKIPWLESYISTILDTDL